MKLLKKILIISGIIILIAAISAVVFIRHINHRCLPNFSKDIKLSGLTEEVTVYRDSLGIPHIIAKNETDLYTAVGYVMAQDRLWQMDLLRRATTGRLSEIFGDDFINIDLQLRSLRITEKSKMLYEQADEEINACLQAFANGVNQYINENTNKLPVEFTILGYKPDKWEIFHSYNLAGYLAWDLTAGWNAEIVLFKLKDIIPAEKLKLLIPNLDLQQTYIYNNLNNKISESITACFKNFEKVKNLGLNVFFGSNNWAISGKKTTTGKPILANDMHLGLFAPGIWYQMHQVVERKINITGVVLPGHPMIICGHNDSIAWGMTNVMLDNIDFYQETLNEDSTKYLLNGEWKDLVKTTEIVKSKSGKTFEKGILYTHRGPIISQFKNISSPAISMKWLGNEYSDETKSVYLINRANNWNDFKNAMRTFSSTSQNVAYADVNGNIGMFCSAGIPIRKGTGIFVAPGDTGLYDWQGLVPFENRPYSYNPEEGYVISANNNTVPDFPYVISHWFHLPYRYNRIKELIEEKEKLSVQDNIKIQTDFKSNFALETSDMFIKDLLTIEKSIKENKAIEILKNWNGEYNNNEIAPTLFEMFYFTFLKNIVADEMGMDLYNEFLKEKTFVWSAAINIFSNKESNWYDDITTDEVEKYQDILNKSLTDALTILTDRYGEKMENWEWGKVHQLTLEHPMGSVKILAKLFKLNSGPHPVGGTYHTVSPYSFKFSELFNVNHGASERHIYSLANWNDSKTVIPTGNSGIPASKYYCNQTKLYVNNLYHNDIVSVPIVKQQAKYVMKIIPNE